ncbi:Hypothetical predicted protein [Paramuricea clavata]|uniref:Uncharacterized protein n=1 Tax=Paramuricea clavata TaxID=317549 RepID=A0A6S7JNW5_PARCT|nr:Hypothetical predicted protein [Paramuricea clavata]
MEISFPPMAMNKTQKTPPTNAPAKTNVTNTSAVNATTLPPTAVNDTPSSSPLSYFEGGNGKQELCPGSGVFIPTIKLRQCHHKSGSDLKVLFHCLIEHFFSEETLAMSVAFGNRVLPTGKQVLDPNIVSAIKGYLLASAKIFHVAPLESIKLNKMFTNKCTCAQTKLKKKLMAFPTKTK